jgi:hypothetical protein
MLSTGANGGVGISRSVKSCFSSSLSCAVANAFGGGKTFIRSATNRTVATGMLSNS